MNRSDISLPISSRKEFSEQSSLYPKPLGSGMLGRSSLRCCGRAAAVAALLASGVVSSASLWDGGSGVWSTTIGHWDGGTNWIPDSSAVFGGVSGTVTLGEAITASSLAFDSNNYVVDLSGFDLAVSGTTGGAAPLLSTAVITNTSASVATYSSAGFASGSGPMLSGNLNVVYTGGNWTPVNNLAFTGTLSLLGNGTVRSDGVNLGSNTSSGLVRLGGTTILNLGTTAGAVLSRTFNRNIELLTDTTSFQAGGDRLLTLAGNISGTGKLRISSSQGGYVLSGNNSYTGTTDIIGAGTTLIAASNTAFGASPSVGVGVQASVGFMGNVNIGSGITISFSGANPAWGFGALQNFSGSNTFGGNITNGSNVSRVYGAEANSTLTLTGVVSGGKGIQKIGQGTIVLTNKNTYGTANASTGNETSVNDGVLRLDFSQSTWETSSAVQTNIINNGINTDVGQTTNGVSQLWLGGGTLEVIGKSGYTNTQNFKNANNNAAPTADNTFKINPGASAVRVVQNGAVAVNIGLGKLFEAQRLVGGTVDFTLPVGGDVLIQNSGTAGGAATVGIANSILIANGAAFATVDGTDWAALGDSRNVLAGSVLAGFYTIATADTLAGNADVSATTDTSLGVDTALTSLRFNQSASRTISATGRILTTGGILVTPGVGDNVSTITGGTLRGNDSATGTLQDLVIFQNNAAGKLTISSVVTDSADGMATGLTKSGKGTLELTAPNTYTGFTTLNNGVLKLGDAAALGGGNLRFKGGVIGLTAASGDFTRALGTGVGQVQFLGSGGFAAYGGDRTVNLGGAAAAVGWGSTSQTTFLRTMSNLILSAPDADGTVIFANPISLQGTGTDTIPTTRVFQVENGSAEVDARLPGIVSGAAIGISKIGNGTLELTATNTYLGDTIVSAGKLQVALAGRISGATIVHSGGTLSGSSIPTSGRSLGAVTINSGGTLAPGIGAGILTTGSLAFIGGTLSLDISGDLIYDQLDVAGTVSLGAPVPLGLTLGSPITENTLFTIIVNDGVDAITFADSAARFTYNSATLDEGSIFTVGSQQFQISYAGGNGNDITLLAVPEPGSACSLFASLGSLVGLARLRRRSL